jgi:hypothetical protein
MAILNKGRRAEGKKAERKGIIGRLKKNKFKT